MRKPKYLLFSFYWSPHWTFCSTKKHKIWLIARHVNSFHPRRCKLGQEPPECLRGTCSLLCCSARDWHKLSSSLPHLSPHVRLPSPQDPIPCSHADTEKTLLWDYILFSRVLVSNCPPLGGGGMPTRTPTPLPLDPETPLVLCFSLGTHDYTKSTWKHPRCKPI